MKKIIYVTIVFATIFYSCKNDSSSGATPRKPITRADLYTENGFISGTIKGESSSGVPFEKSFTHQLDSQMATYFYSNSMLKSYFIQMIKLDKHGRIGDADKKTKMTIMLHKNKTLVLGIKDFYTSIYIDSSATTITKFNINGITSFAFSNVIFNTTDGKFTCDYIMNVAGEKTSSGKPATIAGQINTSLVNVLYKTGSAL